MRELIAEGLCQVGPVARRPPDRSRGYDLDHIMVMVYVYIPMDTGGGHGRAGGDRRAAAQGAPGLRTCTAHRPPTPHHNAAIHTYTHNQKFLQDDLDRLWDGPTIRAIAHPSREDPRATPRLRDLRPPAAVGGGAGRVLLAVGPEGGWDVSRLECVCMCMCVCLYMWGTVRTKGQLWTDIHVFHVPELDRSPTSWISSRSTDSRCVSGDGWPEHGAAAHASKVGWAVTVHTYAILSGRPHPGPFLLRNQQQITMGQRVLRTEAAVPALLALAHDRLDALDTEAAAGGVVE